MSIRIPAVPKEDQARSPQRGSQRFGVGIAVGARAPAGRPLPVVRDLELFLDAKMKHKAYCFFLTRFLPGM